MASKGDKDLSSAGCAPHDEPRLVAPGVRYRERDWHGSGARLSLPPEAPERRAKGDLGMTGLEPPRALDSGGKPYGALTKGR